MNLPTFSLARTLTAVAFGLACSAAADASTFYVATGGNDAASGSTGAPFATIQHAADVAVAGDTIVVRAGTYVGAKFSRSGTVGAPIVLRGDAGAIVASAGAANSNGDNIWVRDASYITVDGLEVRSAARAGIAVQGEPDAESHGVIVRNCFCHDNARWGIFTGYAEGILIENNETSFSGAEHGIYVSNSADNPVIRLNRAHDNNASGIQINADPSLSGDGIISNAVIERNTIWQNGSAGGAAINLASVTYSRVVGNLLYNNHASGIAGWDDGFSPTFGTHDNRFLNNTIVQASDGRFAVSLMNGSFGNVVRNNVLIHPGQRGSIDIDASSETGIDSDYNAITDRYSVDGTFITAAQWKARGHDAHSFVATSAQLFVDAAANNYRLKPGSPAIDAGSFQSAVLRDLDGVPRPQGAAFDIGAYEVDTGRRFDDTPGAYAPTSGVWYLRNTNGSGPADAQFGYGPAGLGWRPLAGDWNGDRVKTIGLYDPSTGVFYLKNGNGGGPADAQFGFGPGGAGWSPLAGDWNGDGVTTIGLYNPTNGVFYLRDANAGGPADRQFGFGAGGLGWKPIAGDWDGDGTTTVGVYVPSSGVFYLRNTNAGGPADVAFVFGPGGAGWLPVAGDWNGDGVTTVGLYDPATGVWYLRDTNAAGPADAQFVYGPPGLTPLAGDWDAQ